LEGRRRATSRNASRILCDWRLENPPTPSDATAAPTRAQSGSPCASRRQLSTKHRGSAGKVASIGGVVRRRAHLSEDATRERGGAVSARCGAAGGSDVRCVHELGPGEITGRGERRGRGGRRQAAAASASERGTARVAARRPLHAEWSFSTDSTPIGPAPRPEIHVTDL